MDVNAAPEVSTMKYRIDWKNTLPLSGWVRGNDVYATKAEAVAKSRSEAYQGYQVLVVGADLPWVGPLGGQVTPSRKLAATGALFVASGEVLGYLNMLGHRYCDGDSSEGLRIYKEIAPLRAMLAKARAEFLKEVRK